MLLRKKLLIAFAVAAAVTLFASWLTSGNFDPVAGKPLLLGALVVLPLVVALKNELTGLEATAVAFTTYFAFAFLGVWIATRKKRVGQSK